MNKFLKKILLGLVIWLIPFLTSFLFWDLQTNAPTVSMGLFNGIMAFAWSIGFSIAMYVVFKQKIKDVVKESWCTGIVWYIELLLLDLIFLVSMFGMSMADFYPMMLTYLNTLLICVVFGYILKNRYR